jgi:peptidyl-prolyl cis-trans isomerase C
MTRSAAPSIGVLARLLAGALIVLPLLPGGAAAQGTATPPAAPPAAGATAPAATAPADPVVAKVDGQPILLSDLQAAAQTLPENARRLPPQALYPMLLDQIIDGRALTAEAHKTGKDQDPDVQRQVAMASQRALENALLQKEIGPQVTDAALKERYDRDVAGKPGPEEVHARHILVPDEATAKQIIAELGKGGDFVALSKKYSKDSGSAAQGGDLGFFKKDDMVPEFADAAFALKDGQVSPKPVQTQFGWHVIQVLEHRQGQPESFDQAREELRQKVIQDGVRQAVSRARKTVTVEKFNLDGSTPRATDGAEPPPAK